MFLHLEGPSKKWMSYFALVGGNSNWSITIHFILRPGIETLWGFEQVNEIGDHKGMAYKAFGLGRLFQVCWNGFAEKKQVDKIIN